jgi:tetratricopeptide (TPR) repeat protein
MALELIQAMVIDRGASARQFDPRADIFSLGALLYELLTGRLPSQPKNADRLAPDAFAPWLEARRRPVVPPRELNPQIDPALEAIVLRCLAAEPEGRQASASELVSALRDYLGWAPAAGRQMRRHRRTLLLTAAGAVVLAVGAAVYIGRLPPPDLRLYEQGLHQFDRGEYDAAQESFRKCIELKPDWPEARFAHGQALRKKGDIAAARAEFLALRDYDLALAYSLAGYCDLVTGNLGGAEADYGLAIQAGANDPTTLNNSGLCAASQGALKRAIDYLDSALAQDPDLAVARCQRAVFSFQESLSTDKLPSERVLTDIREACRLAPDRADFHFHAAAILAMAMKSDQSLKDEARRHLTAALEGGHPPQAVLLNRSKFGILLDEIPRELLKGPLVRKPGKPAALYVSPSETADLGSFIRR